MRLRRHFTLYTNGGSRFGTSGMGVHGLFDSVGAVPVRAS